MSRFFLVVTLLTLAITLKKLDVRAQKNAQNVYLSNINPALMPPSPTAASFQRYGITPVSLAYGIPNINIPIYDLKAGDLTIPIGISYHSNGLKPKDEASWVGLNWTLNAGGVITRIVRGSPDNTRQPGYNYDDIYSSLDNTLYGGNNTTATTFLYNTFFLQLYDPEPDIYTYNFFGHQGKFVLIQGYPFLSDYEHLKIQTYGQDQGFLIIDDMGNQFQFTASEITRAKQATDPVTGAGVVSSWHLTNVKSANGIDWMQFYYGTYTYTEQPSAFSQLYKVSYGEVVTGGVGCGAGSIYAQKEVNQITSHQGNYVYGRSLTMIKTSDGQTVKFLQSSNARKDIASDEHALSQIVVYGQDNFPLDTVVKRVVFSYRYFGDSTSVTTSRLKLTSLAVSNANGTILNNYNFNYFNENNPFPPKNGYAVDAWGYYNANSVQALLPRVSFSAATGPTRTTQNVPAADRSPNAANAKYGLISKITYPTGGYTVFDYEQNQYYNPQAQTNYQTVRANDAVFYGTTVPPALNLNVTTLNIPYRQQVHIAVNRILQSGLSLPQHNTRPLLEIKRLVSGACDDVPPTCVFETLYVAPTLYATNTVESDVTLDAGSYIVTLYCESNSFNTQYGITYQVQTNTVLGTADAPGLRIKSITDYDGINPAPATQKSYAYIDQAGHGTGVFVEDPQFQPYRSAEKGFLAGSGSCGAATFFVYNFNNDNPASYNANLNFKMYYKTVRETVTNISNSYYTEHFFDPIQPPVPQLAQPFGPSLGAGFTATAIQEDISLSDPVEIKSISWKNDGTNYVKVSETQTDYGEILDRVVRGVKPFSQTNNTEATLVSDNYIGFNEYLLYCIWKYPIAQRTITYDGSNQLTTTKNLSYNFRRDLARTEEDLSNGKTIITKSKFPYDYAANLGVWSLVRKNMTSPVIETQIWQKSGTDSSILRGIVTDYDTTVLKPSKKYFLYTGQPLRSFDNEIKDVDGPYETLVPDSHYEEKIRLTYNGRGKLIQAVEDNNQNIIDSYVWGYHNLYPVAKIHGANISAVAGSIDTAALQNLTSDASIRSALNPLRNIANTQVTTATYKPFIGPTSITDLSNKSAYYDYDAFYRLLNVRDVNNNITKTYSYAFTTPVGSSVSNVALQSSNAVGTSGFVAVYQNAVSNETYSFPISSSAGVVSLGSLPPGIYNLNIAKSGNVTTYKFSSGCSGLPSQSAASALFLNIQISAGTCSTISIAAP